jgi:hypothetical protein
MWNLKFMIIPVIIGATGVVTRSLRKKFGSCTKKTFDTHYRRRLHLEQHTQYGKHCSVKLEA